VLLLAVLVACGRAPLRVTEVAPVEGGVEVHASAPVRRVVLEDASGAPVAARTLPVPTDVATVLAPWRPDHAYTVRVGAGARTATAFLHTPPLRPVRIEVAAPLGQESRPVGDGEHLAVTLLGAGAVQVGVVLTAVQPGDVSVRWPGGSRTVHLAIPGAREVVRWSADAAGPQPVEVRADGAAVGFVLDVERLDRATARARIAVASVAFPTDGSGRIDRARPPGRIPLPAPWWTRLLRATRWGWRPRDDQAPWAWQAVTVHNGGAQPVDHAISARVEDSEGQPVSAFRSRVRGAPTGAVSALLRVPAGQEATATLPVFVEEATVREGAYQDVVEITSLGASAPLQRVVRPLIVTRGSPWASGGFLAALLASLAGLVVLARRGRAWVEALDTSELMTIALFGSLTFVVAAAARLLGYGVATVLGPFAPLLTGIFDDAFRTCLLAALIALIPRPGVITLASVVGWLLRGLALGSFHPADLLYLGSVVSFLEGGAWVVGLTRSDRWLAQGPVARWVRLSLGFGVANALSVASGLVITVVLYRLFLADWYVALMVGVHGLLYVVLGCALAVGFADSVRRIAS